MNPVADAGQRLAAIDPTRSFIVQAPAGSGKTELLIQRFLALLGVVQRPDEILAITFTRKAAGEMRTRLMQALEGAHDPAPTTEHEQRTWRLAGAALERDRQLGWRLLENPSLLAIRTIDSFNAALVRRMPWITRLGGLPEVAENPARLYRTAAERTVSRIRGNERGSAQVALLLSHLDNRADRVCDLLVGMLQRRDQWLRHVVWEDHERQRRDLETALAGFVTATLASVRAAVPADLQMRLVDLGRYAAANLPGEEDRPLLALAGLERFPCPIVEDLPAWQGLADLLLTSGGNLRRRLDRNCGFPPGPDGKAALRKEAMRQLLDDLAGIKGLETMLVRVRQLPPAVYSEEQWRVLQALVALLQVSVAELWLAFRENGRTDFAEIALKALEALREDDQPTELLLKLDAGINHILVDEFQDTSHLQFDLLTRLTSGWDRGDGRTLFLVGDPMQSIYRFREAEVGLFLKARREGIGQVCLEPLTLRTNFRSQEGIVDWVNVAFARILPERADEARGAVAYSDAVASRPALPGPAVSSHLRTADDEAAEAGQVVDLVRRTLAEDPDGTVAILVRSRSHLGDILRSLREAGLGYQAQDIDPLAERPIARDLVSLTRALLHPADRLAWLSVLRAPWCGLELADLHLLCGDHPSATIPSLLAEPAIAARLSAAGRSRAEQLFAILSRSLEQRGRVGLRRLVEGTWLALGGPACLDEVGLEDAEQVFDLLERLDHGGDLEEVEALEEGLQGLFAAPDVEADGRLQVMTIHKAKGLEFDTVVLPGLGRSPAQGEQPLLRWLEHPECGLLLAPIAAAGADRRDPIYDAIGRLERDKEDFEVGRLLYVAVTRAKRRLHLLGHVNTGRSGDCRPAAGSLLQKLWAVVPKECLPSPPGEPTAIAETAKNRYLLRRLPAAWTPPPLRSLPFRAQGPTLKPSAGLETGPEEIFLNPWETAVSRHVGTVAHAFLERIAREGSERWSPERVQGEAAAIRWMLTRLGVPHDLLPGAAATVKRALDSALAGDRGRWILRSREDAACELKLSGVIAGSLVHAVIDRTFVDGGVRWIIDYKTSDPEGGDPDDFFARELEHYRPQLAAYGALFRALEKERPIRTALYFPLVDGWCEIDPEADP